MITEQENRRPELEALPIEDYGLIGDCRSAALVGRNGSVDWLCWPHFDSDACFAALLGTADNGRWLLAPKRAPSASRRRYLDDTMILETLFEDYEGTVAIIDFMPIGGKTCSLLRRVEGRSGRVAMNMHLAVRFGYGSSVPWVTSFPDGKGLQAVAGPDRVVLRSGVDVRGAEEATVADFTVHAGEVVDFELTWSRSHLDPPTAVDVDRELAATKQFWDQWSARCTCQGKHLALVKRSLLTLKSLSFTPSGAIVAAPTTSLPEQLGGGRNWDYRYCWLRDATLTLLALMEGGYMDEAAAWRDWLSRAIAGSPEKLQIMYGIWGERRLIEWEASWLKGYQGASPVRIGNAAAGQLQLDVFGEVAGTLRMGRMRGLKQPEEGWAVQVTILKHLAEIWRDPDDGIWESRGERRHYTYSKVMAWVAFDSSIKDAEHFGLDGPLADWRRLRDEIHAEVCARAFDEKRDSFMQSYGSDTLDAVLLLMPLVGFISADDPRMIGTVAAIEEDLVVDGFVQRYRTEAGSDGLAPGEGVFLPCSFWLVRVYLRQGRMREARALFDRLVALCNDLGLLAEEYDTTNKRQVGNFPQAFSHIALVSAALALDGAIS